MTTPSLTTRGDTCADSALRVGPSFGTGWRVPVYANGDAQEPRVLFAHRFESDR